MRRVSSCARAALSCVSGMCARGCCPHHTDVRRRPASCSSRSARCHAYAQQGQRRQRAHSPAASGCCSPPLLLQLQTERRQSNCRCCVWCGDYNFPIASTMALVTSMFLDAVRDGNLMPFLAFACAHACGVLQCPRVLRFDMPSSAHVHEHGLRCMFCHTQCVR